jgi:hypothetical protein
LGISEEIIIIWFSSCSNLAIDFPGNLTKMNKLKQDKNIYLRARRDPSCPRNQFAQNPLRNPRKPISVSKKIAMENAYVSLRRISKKFKIPVVQKVFGKGIIRVSCRNIVQLDNIALIMKGLMKFHLIAEIGMEPLSYSFKMKSLVLLIKPTDAASSKKLDYVFQKYSLTSFKYHHLVIDVECPVVRNESFKTKKIAVKNAYYSLRQILKEFKIPCVKKTFGKGIVQIYCRSVVQLNHIPLIMKEFLESRLIEEIRMPLKWSYKMKNLVLLAKPRDMESGIKIDQAFKNCTLKYRYVVTDLRYPTTTSAKEISQKKENSMTGITYIVWLKIIFLVTVISILILNSVLTRI